MKRHSDMNQSELGDNRITNPAHPNGVEQFSDLLQKRLSRRGFVKSSLVVGLTASTTGCLNEAKTAPSYADLGNLTTHESEPQLFNFNEIEHGFDYDHLCADDHVSEVFLSWGDPIFGDAPEFDFRNQTAAKQLRQFGYNNDYIGYLSLEPKPGESARALLCVNHEYPLPSLMFPDFERPSNELTKEEMQITLACMGNSIVEVVLRDGNWSIDKDSKYNRRITPLNTEIRLSGPALGHKRLRTTADPKGSTVIGTMNNCAGGMTPWGTFLTCEENINYHFSNPLEPGDPEYENHRRYNVPIDALGWGKHEARFDLQREPHEPNRFGWVVEIDPLDPDSTPIKRTALGRFKHEGGENIIGKDGRLVVYMGDDQRFEYLYKFVSRDQVDLENRERNRDLLDHGTLFVAKFFEEGRLEWLPLDINQEPLQNQFDSQGEVLIETRRAAELLGATPM
ncbi:MAG: alkaline phosphatase PhoX, partial [Pseudomonadota bacterium]